MRDRRVASRYAGALLATSLEAGVLDGVAESFAGVLAAVKDNHDLRIFMDSPQVRTQEKKELLKSVFEGHIEPVLLHFFYLLLDKNRMENTRDIGEEFASLVEEHRGVVRARVTTAIALPADLEQQLSDKLARLTGKTIVLEKRVNPRVIGGVKVIIGDEIIDGTVRANLDRLRRNLEKTAVR